MYNGYCRKGRKSSESSTRRRSGSEGAKRPGTGRDRKMSEDDLDGMREMLLRSMIRKANEGAENKPQIPVSGWEVSL